MRLGAAVRRPRLEDVFAGGTTPVPYTYVDRGHLDARLKGATRAKTHVAIHGESKHGKSWLRAHGLRDEECARVQCQPGMTAEQVIEGALGRLGVYRPLTLTSIDSTASTAGGTVRAGHGPAQAELGSQRQQASARELEEEPIAQVPGDLGWAAEQFRTHTRRPVFEDFHLLATDEQKKLAFAIKGLGDWDVPCVVVGIWTGNHLLTYYCGELDGRIEDLRVEWTGEELALVLDRDCAILNVTISEATRQRLLEDAYTSVGLLQQLAHELLREAGVLRRGIRRQVVDDAGYEHARAQVVNSLSARFNPFVDNLAKTPAGGLDPMIASLLWAVTARLDDGGLLAGVAVDALASEITIFDASVTPAMTVAGLERLEAAHRALDIRPAVLAYDPSRRCLLLTDRRFLLYRRLVTRQWPWES